MSKLSKLVDAYRDHMYVPWQLSVAPIQRVIFAVYDKTDELKLRVHVPEFELVLLKPFLIGSWPWNIVRRTLSLQRIYRATKLERLRSS